MKTRRVLAPLCAIALACGMALTAQTPANALAYDNTDPATTGCSAGAITVASASIHRQRDGKYLGYVEMRWSERCGTNWTRVTRTDGVLDWMEAGVWRSGYATRPERYAIYNQIYSNQIYGRNIWVCGSGMIQTDGLGGGTGYAEVCF